MNILEVIGIVFIVMLVIISIKYAKSGGNPSIDANYKKREYVKKHLEVLGVSNNGVSLDDREVYVLTKEGLGL